MSDLKGDLRALAICYRVLGGLVGLAFSLLTIFIFSHSILLWLLLTVIAATVAFALFGVADGLENCRRRVFCLVAAWLI